ncbi:MAG: class I SAM-dependent methyltransferase [Eubacteriaceae bacterium]|nr:class I SAM-dependent methyltransferase [Eubacteriaceae bacterium]
MNLEYLKENWKSDMDIDVMRELWDNSSGDYMQKPIPRLDENMFLMTMHDNGGIVPSFSVLDIGCGSGIYSFAIAPFVREVTGCDLSPKMIEAANERADDLEYENTEFVTLDWLAADIGDLGWEKKFDVVFAHMTPAVNDYETFEKMIKCAKRMCFVQKNVRRTDEIHDALFRELGIYQQKEDNDILNFFNYLWLKGYEPNITCHKEEWFADRKFEDAVKWYVGRAKQRTEVTDEMEEKIREFLTKYDEYGIVTETMNSTIVTIHFRTDI